MIGGLAGELALDDVGAPEVQGAATKGLVKRHDGHECREGTESGWWGSDLLKIVPGKYVGTQVVAPVVGVADDE